MQPGGTYLDWASQAPLHPAAREALLAAYDAGWADPTRLHREGRQARLLYDAAREAVAGALGVSAARGELHQQRYGGGSPGRPRARWRAAGGSARELVVSPIEHSCVLHAARRTRPPADG